MNHLKIKKDFKLCLQPAEAGGLLEEKGTG